MTDALFLILSIETLVPRVMGQTARSADAKGRKQEKKKWDEASFFEVLSAEHEADVHTARRILKWAQTLGLRIWWGEGAKGGSFYPMIDYNGKVYWIIPVWTYGSIEIQFETLKTRPPFDDERKRMELRERLNNIPGVNRPREGIILRPKVYLSTLREESILQQFFNVLQWR